MGCFEVSLGDTVGAGTPTDVRRLLQVLLQELPPSRLAGHFHDTFGQATANVMAAYDMGLRTFDSSVSGLGGCPYSPGAKGNVATEDVVYAFNRMGVETGVDLAELARIGDWISEQLRLPNGSRAGAALVARERQAKALESIAVVQSLPSASASGECKACAESRDRVVYRRGRDRAERQKSGNLRASPRAAVVRARVARLARPLLYDGSYRAMQTART